MGQAHIHLDPLGGLAGDMFLGAVLDAWPDLAEGAFAAMRAAGLPEDWEVRHVPHRDGVLTGSRLAIDPPATGEHAPHGMYVEIRERIAKAPIEPGARARALAILGLLAEAEARVHGRPIEQVHFHELADWDSIADVVGAAFVIEALGASWSTAPLPIGRGRIASSHGALPVPAPAAALLLQGFAVIDDGIEGERVTPTGAAILRHLEALPGLPPGSWRLAATGVGFGTRRLPGMSNALRVLAYERAEAARVDEQVAVIGFEVDDQNPEELALALDALRGLDGVLDVIQLAAIGKKGRLASQVQVLARPERLDATIDACFAETTTLGLRWRIEARAVLVRENVTVAGSEREVAVKVARRPGGARTAKAEVDQIGAGPGGQAGRTRRRQVAEAQALRESGDGEADERRER
jgi:pyridinium-3,5-bisthiocarboxylic acid mononucleotide nickel chelatase